MRETTNIHVRICSGDRKKGLLVSNVCYSLFRWSQNQLDHYRPVLYGICLLSLETDLNPERKHCFLPASAVVLA